MSFLTSAKRYIKLYESSEESRDIWNNRQEYFQKQKEVYYKHIKNSNKKPSIKIQVCLSLIHNPYLLGLYESFKTNDVHLLNNVLYQYGRHRVLDMNSSGYDNSSRFWAVMDGMACNDVDMLEKSFPKELGLCHNGYTTLVEASNLLYILWYKDEKSAQEVILRGNKILMQKKWGSWDKAIISFFIALYNKDIDEAGRQLNQICKSSRRINRPKLYNCFCSEAHGLYNIARNVLTKELFNELKMPEDKGFMEEFAMWQKNNQYPTGELFLTYPDELAFMNDILKCELPKCCLYSDNKNEYLNINKMRIELAENLLWGGHNVYD